MKLQTSSRTHTCGQLRNTEIGKEVTLCGWVNRRRDHGNLIFIDLRDRYGITQLVFDPEINKHAHTAAGALRSEWAVQIKGKVRARGEGLANPKLPTGEIEIEVTSLHVFSAAKTPPFPIADENIEATEDQRLTYRYLELRRGKLVDHLQLRYKIAMSMREFFDSKGFLDVETPILTKSTPEGARDYIVPSRVHNGMFYALPQSPQLFKQLLMIGGVDRYYQIARCFRDEDLRADRQPEFTQLDVEMSFIDAEDIMTMMEEMLGYVFKKCLQVEIPKKFRRMTYQEAMDTYGCDRPDLRYGLEFRRVDEIVKRSNFSALKDQIAKGGIVKVMHVTGGGVLSRKDIDDLAEFVGKFGLKGLAWMKMTEEGLSSSVVKFFDDGLQRELIQLTGAKNGDLLLFGAAAESTVNQSFDHLRRHLGEKLKLADPNKREFLWVVDFPMFEVDKETGQPTSVHHPFTAPLDEDVHLFEKNLFGIRTKAYDVVLNGYELGGGSIRIHNQELQKKIFTILNLTHEEIVKRFGFFINALQYGTPPHGGIALGLDRVAMLMAGVSSIRDVICFPKTQKASDIMMECPTPVAGSQLKELGIAVK